MEGRIEITDRLTNDGTLFLFSDTSNKTSKYMYEYVHLCRLMF